MVSPSDSVSTAQYPILPSLMLTNANHILNKIDELSLLTLERGIDIVCVTESWLTDEIPDNVCDLNNYVLFRKDRSSNPGGGVLCYVNGCISCRKVDVLCSSTNDFEVLCDLNYFQDLLV